MMGSDVGTRHARREHQNRPSNDSPAPSGGTRVIGLGNLMRGDDGVGVRVTQMLMSEDLPDGVQVVDGSTRGLGLVSLMEGWQRVILVDAADVGQAPGRFVRFTPQETQLLGQDLHLSAHESGLRDALLLANALNLLPEEIVIYGVQPASLDWEDRLSPQVEATIPVLVGSILDELQADTAESSASNTLANEQEEGNHGK